MRPDSSSWARWSRRLVVLSLVILALVILGHLTIRFVIWPQLETSKPAVEKLLSQRIGVEVKIDQLHVYWEGIRPIFDIVGLEFIPNPQLSKAIISDAPGLRVREIRGELSWSSFYHLKPYFTKLHASDAVIQVTRDHEKKLFVAGILAGEGGDDLDVQNWLLSQGDLKLSNLNILWKDFAKSKSEVASLRIESLQLKNGIRQHALETALYSPWHQGKLSLSGDFVHRLGGGAGNWRDWIGDFKWDIQELDIGQLSKDFEIPFKQLGGIVRSAGSLSLSKGLPDGGQFSIAIDKPIFQQSKSNQAIEFGQVQIDAKQFTSGKFISLGIQRFAWRETNQKSDSPMETLAPMTLGWQIPKKDSELEKFSFSSTKISLEKLTLFALNLPIPNRVRQLLEQNNPRGELNDIALTWSESKSNLPFIGALISDQGPQFDISASLSKVSIKGDRKNIPGISNLSGQITGNQNQGGFKLDSQNLQLLINDFLVDPQMAFNSAKGSITWSMKNKQWQIGMENLNLNNREIAFNVNGNYLIGKEEVPDTLDLNIQFDRADLQTLHRYLPAEMSKDARTYIQKAFISGQIKNASLKIKGDPNKAPFDVPGSGELSLNLPITNVVFRPAPLFPASKGVWQEFTDLEGRVSMQQAKLSVDLKSARYKGLQIQNLNATIPSVSSSKAILNLKSEVAGPVNEMMDYLRTTPALLSRPNLANNLKPSGNAKLDLELNLPLQNTDDLKLNALLQLENNTVVWSDLAPFNKVKGSIRLTEDMPLFEQVSADFFGGTINLKHSINQTQNKIDLYDISGNVDLNQLKSHFGTKAGNQSKHLLNALGGSIGFKGNLSLSSKSTDLNLDLDLNALSAALPEPLNKKRGTDLKGQFKYQSVFNESTQQRSSKWSGQLGKLINLQGRMNVGTGMAQGIGIGAPASIPDQGIGINVIANDLNIDDWHSLLYPKVNKAKNQKNDPGQITQNTINADEGGLTAFTARVANPIALNRLWPNLNLNAKLTKGSWQISVKSPRLEGEVQYQERAGYDLISGKLIRMYIPPSTPRKGDKEKPADKQIALDSIPELNLSIDDLTVNQYKPGAVAIKTRNSLNRISIESARITKPSAVTNFTGEWTTDALGNNERVLLDISSQINDLGTVISHWGSPKAVEGGKGKVTAKLDWSGPPYDPSFDTLAGQMNINLENGRLMQVDSGFAKIIGVFSLQSLLKFASFDIQGSLGNVVTAGTSFNNLSGDFVLRNGVARTQNFTMQLNQARVATSGLVNIPKQTQDLRITIFPTIDATAGALALFAVNPIVGASALIGQYLISNQLNRTLQTDYLVQGSWDKPDVIPLDQNGKPLDPKVIETIRAKNLLREQKKPTAPTATPPKTNPANVAPAN